MPTEKKIFFTTPALSTFVEKDLEILQKYYRLKLFLFRPKNKWLTPVSFLNQLVSIIGHLFTTDLYICKFPGYLSFLPVIAAKITGKPCLLITAGTESAGLNSIRYGNYIRPVLAAFTSFSLRLASHIAPVHRSLMSQVYSYDPRETNKQQGVLHFCKGLKTPFTEIFYGFDDTLWKPATESRQPNSIITIASGFESEVVFMRKGVDLIYEVAPLLPHYTFTIVGAGNSAGFKNVPSNVVLLPKINQARLAEELQKNEFYAQLSMFEGFPNALCEAMLCGCIPIGSNVSAIPDIIGETGFILDKKDSDKLFALIKGLQYTDKNKMSLAARERIITNFSTGKREKKLVALIEKLTGSRD